ncbi:uncharacterized protein [Nicotiana tomentosiformis]|uniref:uncharacterized protein n=1 Tax=Nicotiana tomentosiformis TaxID=4098 RepID=UPI00051C0356|nr:histone H3.v1-like [Nicotiana tomentosiformis]
MPKASQTPSKTKSSTKAEAKSKILKPKSKKNDKPSREPTPKPAFSSSIYSTIPTPSSFVPTAPIPIIPTSIVSPPSKETSHAPELHTKNTSKSAKVKATSRKYVKKVLEAATQIGTRVKESVIQGESGLGTNDQVPYPTSKLDVLVSNIDVAPLDTLPPISERSPVEKFMVEESVGDLGKKCKMRLLMALILVGHEEGDEGEKEEETVNNHEEHDFQNIPNEEEKSENERVFGDEKESDTDDKTGEHANNSTEEENQSEEEEVSESKGEDHEDMSESEGGNDESEQEEGNVSEESEGSMTIGNTVIAPSEEIGEVTRAKEIGSLLTPFTGDEEVSSDEDNMPLSKFHF